ncbi:Rhophilin, Rho GTPase binding protein 1 [Branchiostoma belcheri]|nr:Rhophilin, Rho GTPase binding protein 1 [Branchiostoma belcheri]
MGIGECPGIPGWKDVCYPGEAACQPEPQARTARSSGVHQQVLSWSRFGEGASVRSPGKPLIAPTRCRYCDTSFSPEGNIKGTDINRSVRDRLAVENRAHQHDRCHSEREYRRGDGREKPAKRSPTVPEGMSGGLGEDSRAIGNTTARCNSTGRGSNPLNQTQRGRLQHRRSVLNTQINKEMRMRAGAENLYSQEDRCVILRGTCDVYRWVNGTPGYPHPRHRVPSLDLRLEQRL